MIINLRGTSGSGKSTLVRRVMNTYDTKMPFRIEGRRQPIGYLLHKWHPTHHPGLWVVGHYETPCGGCDTIGKNTLEVVYDQVRKAHAEGHDVIYEGVIVTSDVRRCAKLHEDGLPLLVIGLDTPIDVCVASVEERRRAKSNTKPLDPKNTIAKHKTCEATMRRLKEAGVDARWLSREAGFEAIMEALG